MPALIELGSTGPDVSKWQTLLNGAGFAVSVTGTFDQETDEQTRKWQASKGLVVDGRVGPASWAAMTSEKPKTALDKNAQFGRTVLENVWLQVTGETPNLSELQIAGAQAHLESNYGLANYTNKKTGEKSGVINNWGAVQGGKPPCGASGFEATDTHADGTEYSWCYKRYPSPEAGAADMLKEMTTRRPTSWAHMKAGDIDAWAAAMRTKDPITGVGLYFEQSAEGRAKGIELRVNNIAATLGEPVAAKRGGPIDAEGLGTRLPDEPGAEDGGFSVPSGAKGVGILALISAAAYAAYHAWRKGWLPW